MGQQRIKNPKSDDPKNRQNNGNNKNRKNNRKPADTAVVASTNTRRGEVWRASRRNSDLVNAKATQHIVDVPVNRSVYNGRDGRQFTTGDLRRANKLPIAQQKTLKVIPLGGLGEMGIGKNMAVLEYENDIIVIDMGMLFPSGDYPGINYLLPDISYLEERKHKIRGIVFTHAHLDHIGGVKNLLRKIPAPVYGSKFTIGMVQRQMEEDPTGYKANLNVVDPDKHERVKLGDSFTVELIRVNHSVPDSTAIAIKTPVGTVIHSGDWRFEDNPIDGKKFDFKRLEEIANEGVLLLMNESTNCENMSEISHGEENVAESFNDIMDNAKGRIIISAFSSQLHRIQSILDAAKKHNRKVALAGYSMIQNMEVALRSGVVNIPKDTIMKMDDIVKMPDEKVVIVATGSQGEMNAVLWRMATGSHRHIRVKPQDTIVFSSNPIPGNETNVVRTVDGLMREGPQVLQNHIREFDGCGPLHLSGHGNYHDHVKFIGMIKPKFYMPIHGEYHMLVHNAELAHRTGIAKDNIFVMDSGDVLELTAKEAARTKRVKTGSIMYDGAGAQVSEVVLKDRIHMSTEGIFTVILTVDRKTGSLMTSPDIISRGFIYLRDSEELMSKIRRYLKQKVASFYRKGSGSGDAESLKKSIREDIAHILYDETERTPIVIPVINEITPAKSGQRSKEATENTAAAN